MTEPATPSPRQRGGQPGNVNALKHGFYTRHLPGMKEVAEEALQTEFPGFEEEIFILRLYVRRLLEWSAAAHEFDEAIVLYRTLCLALATLARLSREHRALTADPVDNLATLRAAHAGITQMQPAAAAFKKFRQDLAENHPEISWEETDAATYATVPADLFDAPAPSASPVEPAETAAAAQSASPEGTPSAARPSDRQDTPQPVYKLTNLPTSVAYEPIPGAFNAAPFPTLKKPYQPDPLLVRELVSQQRRAEIERIKSWLSPSSGSPSDPRSLLPIFTPSDSPVQTNRRRHKHPA
jgi:hypothetical protein